MIEWQHASEAEMRRAIAERLGYKERRYRHSSDWLYKLVDAKGKTIADSYVDEGDAWFGSPNWYNDANAALALPISDDYEWHIGSIGLSLAKYSDDADCSGYYDMFNVQGRTPRDMCIAWLMMKDSEK